jgi:hypothetical protein
MTMKGSMLLRRANPRGKSLVLTRSIRSHS